MSIIQISKIQQRSGDLVDLPQLDEAEFGFATDERRLFIGKTVGETQNIEVLTAYSPISFDQIEGVTGNINIDANTLANGQVFAYDGTYWINKGGNAGGYINLGNISNVAIQGGTIGYVATTDGSGNLSWTPKGIVTANINTISDSASARLTLVEPYPFATGSEITINLVDTGNYDTLNGDNFYIKAVAGNIQLYDLYEDSALTTPVSTSGYGTYPTDTGIIIFNTAAANGGAVGGITGSVQFNSGTDFAGEADFIWDFTNNILDINGGFELTGNANVGNVRAANGVFTSTVNAASVLTSTITTGSSSTAGSLTGNWTLTSGSKLTATYADLAEYYAADQAYIPGTVLEFGGEQEVTLANPETNKIAGVVSSEPAYVMNGGIQADNPVMIAMIGRVPVRVTGHVSKGDMLISAGNGLAKASILQPKIGTVIGKAIQNKWTDGEGVVEVLVGRM